MAEIRSRRPLAFADLAAVVAAMERLDQSGYDRVGAWSLGQAAHHLGEWVRYSLDGFPMRGLPWVVRATAGRAAVAVIVRVFSRPGFRVKAGSGTLAASIAPADVSDRAGVDHYRRMVDRFDAHRGPLVPPPITTWVGRDAYALVQRVHAAHHLGFLLPH